MVIEINAEWEKFIEQEVTQGRFSDSAAVVEHALRLLLRDREEAIEGIKAGLADVAAGRTQLLGQAFDELRSELRISDE